ncbi:MAG: hypothetical protein KGJ79_17465 [Alphaproteobacteria bacterium]|nr:hypothetical protein [Alphaproteobacteria bacterium]MDE2493659.1 hypothetical protein [Alphaproteobacteria bacterium]
MSPLIQGIIANVAGSLITAVVLGMVTNRSSSVRQKAPIQRTGSKRRGPIERITFSVFLGLLVYWVVMREPGNDPTTTSWAAIIGIGSSLLFWRSTTFFLSGTPDSWPNCNSAAYWHFVL